RRTWPGRRWSTLFPADSCRCPRCANTRAGPSPSGSSVQPSSTWCLARQQACYTGETACVARGAAVSDGGAAGSVFVDDDGLGRDHLPATVVAVGGDVVADVDLAGGRIGRQLLGAQLVVRAALATAGGGDAGFLHSHGNCSSRVRLLLLLLQCRQRRERVGACFFVRRDRLVAIDRCRAGRDRDQRHGEDQFIL